jgi:hypothetical protein
VSCADVEEGEEKSAMRSRFSCRFGSKNDKDGDAKDVDVDVWSSMGVVGDTSVHSIAAGSIAASSFSPFSSSVTRSSFLSDFGVAQAPASLEALSDAISARASASCFSVSASFSSSVAMWSLRLARCLRWFSRTRFKVCSAETRPLRRGASASWDDVEDTGDSIVF